MNYTIPLIFVPLFLSGCLSPEMQIARSEGVNLHHQFRSACDASSWETYPQDVRLVRVKRQRNKEVRNGENCIKTDTVNGSVTQCKDTYKNVREEYYQDEYQDFNKSIRGKFYRSCMADECFSAVNWNAPTGDMANRYCKHG